jgi:hypothetical protein
MKPGPDWMSILRRGIEAKAKNPRLKKYEFYAMEGFDTPSRKAWANRTIGRLLDAEWIRLQKGALSKVQKDAQVKLAKTVTEIIQTGQLHATLANSRFLPRTEKDKDGNDVKVAGFTPKNFRENLQALRVAGKLTLEGVKTLTGGKEVQETQEVDGTVNFHSPEEKADATSARKKGPPKGK